MGCFFMWVRKGAQRRNSGSQPGTCHIRVIPDGIAVSVFSQATLHMPKTVYKISLASDLFCGDLLSSLSKLRTFASPRIDTCPFFPQRCTLTLRSKPHTALPWQGGCLQIKFLSPPGFVVELLSGFLRKMRRKHDQGPRTMPGTPRPNNRRPICYCTRQIVGLDLRRSSWRRKLGIGRIEKQNSDC